METRDKCYQNRAWPYRFWCYMGYGVLGVIGFGLFALIFGWVIMVLWNALMPALFGLKVLSFWEAVGLAILARLLFGTAHSSRHPWRYKDRYYYHHPRWSYYAHKYDWKNHRHNYKDYACNPGKWQYYEQYWEEEGEKAFKDYVEKKKEEDKKVVE